MMTEAFSRNVSKAFWAYVGIRELSFPDLSMFAPLQLMCNDDGGAWHEKLQSIG